MNNRIWTVSCALFIVLLLSEGCIKMGQAGYNYYGVTSTIEFLPSNSSIADNQSNFELLLAELGKNGITVIQSSFNNVSNFAFENVTSGQMHGDISINNTSIILESWYMHDAVYFHKGDENNQDSLALFEKDKSMLRPRNDMISNIIKSVYGACVSSESYSRKMDAFIAD